MRYALTSILTFALLSTGGTLWAQWLVPQKDIAFAQVAVGPSIETVITLTNRGLYEGGYAGRLIFKTGINGAPWNPIVNGARITDGEYPLTILPDDTLVVRITGTTTLDNGFVILQAGDLILDNFVEANLTYYVRQNGTIVDSVGVSPSVETYLTAIPFEDFSEIALALANPSSTPGSVQVLITPIDGPSGAVLPGKTVELSTYGHTAQFLTELFPDIQMGRGKVEISAPQPIIGTALTSVAGQLSSLPLLPSPVAYSMTLIGDAGSNTPTYQGSLTLWAEGYFVKGYMVISQIGDQNVESGFVILVNGQLIDRFLDLSFFAESKYLTGDDNDSRLLTIYLGDLDFLFSDGQATGEWLFTYLDDRTTEGGTFTMDRTTP